MSPSETLSETRFFYAGDILTLQNVRDWVRINDRDLVQNRASSCVYINIVYEHANVPFRA